jgi:hypothetical protein
VTFRPYFLGLEVALAQVRCGVVELDRAVLLEMNDDPGGRGAVQGEARDLELPQPVAEAAAAVGLLDAAREWALAPDARTIGVGEAGAGERTGREDERVGRRQRIDGGRAEVEERPGDPVPAGPDDLLAVQLALRDPSACQIDVVVGTHDTLLKFGT